MQKMQKDMSDSVLSNGNQKDDLLPRLLIGAIIINFFVYCLAGLSLYNSHAHYNKLAATSTQNFAKNLEANISGIIDKIDVGVFAVSREAMRQLVAGGINRKELDSYIQKQIAQHPELYGLRVTDADGNLLYGTDIPADTAANISDREYFKRLRDNPKEGLVISNAIQGRISGKWNITFARRINGQDGSFAGVAIAMFDASYFDKLFSQLDIGKYGAIGIRDLDLRLVALQPKGKEPGSQIGSNVISAKTKEMIQVNPETATYKAVFARDNLERIVTFRKVARYPFYIFATIATIDYMAPWKKEATITLTLLAVFSLSTFVSTRMILRGMKAEMAQSMAIQYSEEMSRKNNELIEAFSRIKRLEGIISICMYCKKIRSEQESWAQLETYLTEHTDAMFSHGICPDCYEKQIKTF